MDEDLLDIIDVEELRPVILGNLSSVEILQILQRLPSDKVKWYLERLYKNNDFKGKESSKIVSVMLDDPSATSEDFLELMKFLGDFRYQREVIRIKPLQPRSLRKRIYAIRSL